LISIVNGEQQLKYHYLYTKLLSTMAIAIKSIPILKEKTAVQFSKKAKDNIFAKHTVNFSEQTKTASQILAKAKI